MNRDRFRQVAPRAIALVGTYLPRRCGIATFTAELLNALSAESPRGKVWALAMNDRPEGYHYPSSVRFELNYKSLEDYRLAADFLNVSQVGVVSLQHEYGIYGGPDGSYILEFARRLRVPVVTTLHTVLQQPSPGQRKVMENLHQISERLVVMSEKAKSILKEVYGASSGKIVVIPHGIPDMPFVDPNYYKDQFGVEGRKVILTFGLVSPGKGLEYMIDAMPEIVERFPDATYIILGATHPHVLKEQGESYRLSLQRRARDLHVESHLVFHNRFVDLEELCEFLGAADIYVTPYLNREQIVSGTLAYALGAGKATISTPYWYAEEMLQDGRGRLVPFRDSKQLAAQVIDLLENEVRRHQMRKRAYTYYRHMVWKEVAHSYLDVFIEVRQERERRPRIAHQVRTLDQTPPRTPELKIDHLQRLTDDVGMLQHAKFIVPDRQHGYCTDDNARALIVAILAGEFASLAPELSRLSCLYLSFLNHAFNSATGRFRNFMAYERRWLEEQGSEDCHARALWGLGTAAAWTKSENVIGISVGLFERALPAMLEFQAPRAWAIGLVGIHTYLRHFSGDSEARRVRAKLAEQLFGIWTDNSSDEWPWIEDTVTYDNGKISQALLMSGQWLQRGDMVEAGLRSLEWLLRIQTGLNDCFEPIGNSGWYRRGGTRARFDQQPLEAQSMIEACGEAFNVTGDEKWLVEARRVFEWFLGRNDNRKPLYDYQTGGCSDGLTSDGVNMNQGAESTLAFLLSLLNIRMLEHYRVAPVEMETVHGG